MDDEPWAIAALHWHVERPVLPLGNRAGASAMLLHTLGRDESFELVSGRGVFCRFVKSACESVEDRISTDHARADAVSPEALVQLD